MSVHKVWVFSNNLIWAEKKFYVKKIRNAANTLNLCYNRDRYATYLQAVRLKLSTKEVQQRKYGKTGEVVHVLIKYHDTKMYGGLKVYFNARV